MVSILSQLSQNVAVWYIYVVIQGQSTELSGPAVHTDTLVSHTCDHDGADVGTSQLLNHWPSLGLHPILHDE